MSNDLTIKEKQIAFKAFYDLNIEIIEKEVEPNRVLEVFMQKWKSLDSNYIHELIKKGHEDKKAKEETESKLNSDAKERRRSNVSVVSETSQTKVLKIKKSL